MLLSVPFGAVDLARLQNGGCESNLAFASLIN